MENHNGSQSEVSVDNVRELTFADLLSDEPNSDKVESEPEVAEDAQEVAIEKTEDKSSDVVSSESQEKTSSKKGFKFDPQKYIDDGITDEKALKQFEDLERRVWERDRTIGRQGNELGDVRKQIKDIEIRREELSKKKDLSDEEYNELHDLDPAQARRRSEEALQARQEDEKLLAEQTVLRNKAFLGEKMPNFEDHINTIAELIESDLPEEVGYKAKKDFLNDPYKYDGSLTFNLAKRAELKSQNTKLENDIATYKKEIEDLKSALKDAPTNALKKVEKMTSNPHSFGVNSGSTGSATSEPAPYSSILTMSREELLADLKKTG